MPPGHQYPIAPEAPPAEAPVGKKGWVHSHPYLATSIAAISLLIILFFVVAARTGVGGSTSANNWVGAGSVFFTGGRTLTQAERMSAEAIVKQQSPKTALGYIPIPAPNADGSGAEDFANDLGKLLFELSVQPNAPISTPAETSSGYSLIPQGLISVSTGAKQRSPEAEVLFTYGNEVGTYIQGFESLHLNSVQMMKDHAEDRQNADKTSHVDRLGYEMAELGRDLGQLQTVPADIKAAHAALATSYRLAGTNLTKVAATKTDEEFLGAINTYNASVESLAKRFLVIVGIFSANEVSFSSSDPGSIFMFSPTLSF